MKIEYRRYQVEKRRQRTVGYFSEEDCHELNLLLMEVYGELNKIITTMRNIGN